MRDAFTDKEWMKTEDGRFLGVALGYDFCAEHEIGTRELKDAFGVPSPKFPMGLPDRLVSRVPQEGFIFRHFKAKAVRNRRSRATVPAAFLLYVRSYGESPEYILQERTKNVFHSYPEDHWYNGETSDFATAWSQREFAIAARGKHLVEDLELLYNSFLNQDVLFGAGLQGGWSAGRGLTFMLNSRMSQEWRDQVLQNDLDHKQLLEAVAATGIEAHLEAHGKRWFALSPQWADAQKRSVKFFLNPWEQSKYASGWFTVEELQAWACDEGPVIKKASQAA